MFDAKEKAALLYADRVTRGAAANRDNTLEELKKHFTEDQILEECAAFTTLLALGAVTF